MADTPSNPQLDAVRLALPGLLGELDQTSFHAIQPYLTWKAVELTSGAILFREGDPSDSVYVVVSGRLQAALATSTGPRLVGEFGRGELIGEMGVFTGQARRATVTAARDSVLARIELAVFERILQEVPSFALKLNRVIVERLERRDSQKMERNITNVAIVSLSKELRPGTVLQHLIPHLEKHKSSVLHITSSVIDAAAGRQGAAQVTESDSQGHRWLVDHLDQLERRYNLVLYETDPTPSPWTRRCLRQADEIWLIGTADASPALSDIERECLTGSNPLSHVRHTLILLHPDGAEWAIGTPAFLALRPNVSRYHHVRIGQERDFARLARFMNGTAVGLVLAGGGARGLAHIGVIRALEEAQVPVDSVCGTSIGSVLAACVARDWSWRLIFDANREAFLSNPTSDFNLLPLVSLLAGRKLDRILSGSFGDRQIEEMWRPFFCVSSNYSHACEVVHDHGNIKRAILASMAIPGVFPPIVSGADLLVDGGLLNNMPVDVMARSGVSNIMAVDLRPDEKQRPDLGCDQVPTMWQLLVDRFKPEKRRRYHLPSMLTILTTSTTLNSYQRMSQVLADVDLLFKPDVRRFGLLEWKSYDAIVEQGYRHAQEMIAKNPAPF